ncbi:hypothetical protein FisN_4Hh356 [Fistulifera solaris]|jgi:sodium-coupled neutral amino acid transporter 11|uniref:Amino acid transporter transmembrane domain-containing protein n=1 Tax=Fistulifera solaris TaxID=1519565 RepID=A0A1Z5KQ65_FISSO|nr:hypothetical protein FisN_4Hh356 [Fistulifera solaris]|eukprot:GAX28453.1 hypothetical protein FisN_4Hh356 [Fistulifera solaris]
MSSTNAEPELEREQHLVIDTTPIMNESIRDGAEEADDEAGTVRTGSSQIREGTIASGRFNILSTMVGGGSLSLPLAFQKTGNGFLAPVLLLIVACMTEFCFRTLTTSARTLSPPDHNRRGQDSYESIASAAFGRKAYVMSTVLVTAMCFFGTVAYAVLLRDMLQPISEYVFERSTSGPTWENNVTMLTVVVLVTPLCTLKTLTALQRFGALGMFSVLVLGSCIVYRSIECTAHHADDWKAAFQWGPNSWRDVLDVFPLFVSCYVCHYNIPVVHNELHNPTTARVAWWLKSTTWTATLFYMLMGVAGSAYAPCAASKELHGNVLLDFDNDDPVVMVGRMCLALTITLAFPMLTIPARDIVIRTLCSARTISAPTTELLLEEEIDFEEPLLADHDNEEGEVAEADDNQKQHSLGLLLFASIGVFWIAALLASCVSSIDIVWELLGSSLSIFMSYLIPCGSYLVIIRMRQVFQTEISWKDRMSVMFAWFLVLLFIPLMFLSSANAVYKVFLR